MSKEAAAQQPEAGLEARLAAAISQAFPGVAVEHQTRFSLRLGRSEIDVDGSSTYVKSGRADILVRRDGAPLAIFELKRPGLSLTAEDEKQGLSYARVHEPPAPLVVVTNGEDVIILDSYTGAKLEDTGLDSEGIQSRLAAVSRAAAADLQMAVEHLLGPTADLWVQAVRAATRATIDDLTGDWDDVERPFVADFLAPRVATHEVVRLLGDGERVVCVSGAPVIGKSSVLREVAQRLDDSEDLAILFVEADSVGSGVYQRLADVVGAELGWPATTEDIKTWLVALSHRDDGPVLVLLIDSLGAGLSDARRDLEHLVGPAFGPHVRLVVALDDAVAEEYSRNAAKRDASKFGRAAKRVRVEPLSGDEFDNLGRVLIALDLGFMSGARRAMEFRSPWVIRSMIADAVGTSRSEGQHIALPPLLGPDLIERTRRRFSDVDLRRRYRGLARGVLDDAVADGLSAEFRLHAVSVFLARYSSVAAHLDGTDLSRLRDDGHMRLRELGAETLAGPSVPELLAAELSVAIAAELPARMADDAAAACDWLTRAAAAVPLGDSVAAYAIAMVAEQDPGFSLDSAVCQLFDMPPERQQFAPGTRVAMLLPGLGVIDATFNEDGSVSMELPGGRVERIGADEEGDEHGTIGNFMAWMILSHLASIPMEAVPVGGGVPMRADHGLLLEVGACALPLRRPTTGPDPVASWDMPDHGRILCQDDEIIEPIVWSMVRAFFREGAGNEAWVREAARRASLPLLTRVRYALHVPAHTRDEDLQGWARAMLREVVLPALDKLPPLVR